MHEFFISPKVARLLLVWTIGAIVVLLVACVIFDKEDEKALQTVKLDCYSLTEITSKMQKTNVLLEEQGVKIGEMNNSMTGIFGIAKGTMEVSPSLKPEINIYPGKPRTPRKPHKDTLVIETKGNTKDSIEITINSEDSIVTATPSKETPGSPTKKKCCCCNCCCDECRKEGCR